MANMNYEAKAWRRDAIDTEVVDGDLIERARKRRRLIVAAIIAAVAIIGALLFMTRGEEAAPAGGANAASLPTVTVVVPGRQLVSSAVSANGTLAARRDMPVGVAGEGGMVTRVLVEPGQWVRAGQTLAVIERSVQVQQAQQMSAQIQVAQAEARLAQQELDRAKSLVDRGFVSKADVDRRQATRDSANARVRVAQATYGEMRARIGRLDVTSPTSGLVLDRMVEPGQIVSSASGALFRIAMNGEMEMLARLSQEDLTRVRTGIPAQVTPVGSAETFTGTVWQVSPVVDPQTRQGDARILLRYNPSLRPGGFATARIVAGQAEAPLLPESAVQSDERGNFVYVIKGKNEAARRDVRIGQVTDAGVSILSGLQGNEQVIESAGAFLNPGDKVTPVRAPRR